LKLGKGTTKIGLGNMNYNFDFIEDITDNFDQSISQPHMLIIRSTILQLTLPTNYICRSIQ